MRRPGGHTELVRVLTRQGHWSPHWGQAPGCGSRMQSHTTITITDLITAVNINTASINLPSSLVRDQRDHNKILVTSSWCWHVLTSWSGSSSSVVLNNDQGAITINCTDTSGYITVHTTPRWTAAQDNVISCFMPQHHTTNNTHGHVLCLSLPS